MTKNLYISPNTSTIITKMLDDMHSFRKGELVISLDIIDPLFKETPIMHAPTNSPIKIRNKILFLMSYWISFP